MRVASIVLLALIASATAAQATCQDDLKDVRLKVDRAQRTHWSPQTAAAAKELQRYDDSPASADMADDSACYNTIARVERALNAPPPVNSTLKPGQAAQPIEDRARPREEQGR
ncbi:MAG TPA: hypothetical protein VLV85_12790 [Stellaceae bacterium]|nr:hypothetical protein [Stellaceae bacterium]